MSYNEKMPQVGQSILFFANSDDKIALSNNKQMGDPIAAIVTTAWSTLVVNLKLIPDHGPMQDRGSVPHKSSMEKGGGYYWQFPEEYYAVKGGEEIPAGSFTSQIKVEPLMVDGNVRRIREDLMVPAEKAIHNSIKEIEKIGADVRLTNAQNLLQQAKELVADYVDETMKKS